jgi:hypothetical protein
LKIQIWVVQTLLYVKIMDFQLHFANTLSNVKMVYIWNVDLDECNNIGIHDFFSRDHAGFRKPAFGYEFFKNLKLSGSNFYKWKVDHYTKCRYWWVKQTLYSWVFHSRPSRVRSKCVFLKTNVLTLVKLGQMTYLMTSNEKLLNTKLLELIKIYIWYMDHIFIWINFSKSQAHVFKIEDRFWSDLVKWQAKWLEMKNFGIPSC